MNKEARQVALNVSGGLLVVATLVFLAYIVWGLMNREVSLNNKDLLNIVLGVLLAKYSDLISFFFGSSHTNKQQTETMDKLAETAKAATSAVVPTPTIKVDPGEKVTVESRE